MRAFFWLWVMFLLLCLVTDSASYWVVGNRLSRGLELALDAALVSGIAEEDLIWGRQLLRKDRAEERAREILRQNMSGAAEESLTLYLWLIQDEDQIWAEGQAKIRLPSLLGALAGRGSREITVNKRLRYLGSYK